MRAILAIAILLPVLISMAACSLPEPTRPELDKNAEFPNLADVPERPETMPPAERERILRDLQNANTQINER